MLEPTASRFWQAALQSGLVDAEALQRAGTRSRRRSAAPEHIDRRLARQAVQAGLLTLWQAQQLIAGRSGGFKIDRYVLLGLIGQGGMGRVYLARDTRLNRRVALKILSPERVNNPRAIARFHREALVGAQLQHENLVRIYDEGEAGGKCYLVMEYIEGKNIGQMIAEGGPIPPAVAARLGRQVALGLEHAQRKGLIHRDVNPYNILVTRDGTAKLTDLGLAIDLADQDRVTRDGATVGTFDYVSPEQARHSHSVDTRSDIYSLGCTLYHMLAGQVPFPSASLPEKLFGHQAVDPEPLTKLVPGRPEGLAAVVARMMRKSPDDRYATPLELAQALEPFADVAPGPDPGRRRERGAAGGERDARSAPAATAAAGAATGPAVVRGAPPAASRRPGTRAGAGEGPVGFDRDELAPGGRSGGVGPPRRTTTPWSALNINLGPGPRPAPSANPCGGEGRAPAQGAGGPALPRPSRAFSDAPDEPRRCVGVALRGPCSASGSTWGPSRPRPPRRPPPSRNPHPSPSPPAAPDAHVAPARACDRRRRTRGVLFGLGINLGAWGRKPPRRAPQRRNPPPKPSPGSAPPRPPPSAPAAFWEVTPAGVRPPAEAALAGAGGEARVRPWGEPGASRPLWPVRPGGPARRRPSPNRNPGRHPPPTRARSRSRPGPGRAHFPDLRPNRPRGPTAPVAFTVWGST